MLNVPGKEFLVVVSLLGALNEKCDEFPSVFGLGCSRALARYFFFFYESVTNVLFY